jgi:hypothetical protein
VQTNIPRAVAACITGCANDRQEVHSRQDCLAGRANIGSMMNTLRSIFAITACLVLQSAKADGPPAGFEGVWVGRCQVNGADVFLGMRVDKAERGITGIAFSRRLGIRRVPLANGQGDNPRTWQSGTRLSASGRRTPGNGPGRWHDGPLLLSETACAQSRRVRQTSWRLSDSRGSRLTGGPLRYSELSLPRGR